MKQIICEWKGCKKKIEIDNSSDCSFFSVGGWCDEHHKQYARERNNE